jgi:methionine-rich copper-binding protein CopC
VGLLVGVALVPLTATPANAAPCDAPVVNPVACENTKPGNPASEWDVSGAGSSTIQGFATDISVNVGDTVRFKVDTPATSYRLDIYRMGYYGGNGARKVATVTPSASLPQNQPDCLSDTTTGLIDCGNWAVSASWAVPADAVSGIYFAKLVRTDATAGSSHIPFVVRNDASHSALLFQTSDTTWQAYNQYGGNSLYVGSPANRAFKVSYNRPFTTRGTGPEDFVFNAEYPMVRFLEANGYDTSYMAGVDTDRRGALIRNHKVFMSVGHDEYWSGQQRANVEAARDAGVNLAFFSGNESFWKTRYEPSIDGSNTAYRTLVTYKETHANAVIDPADPPTWTGTWRDPRFSPPADGNRPENNMTGTIFKVNSGTVSLQVPAADGKMRLWRNTSVATQAAGAVASLGSGTVGYEWDEDADNGARSNGLITMSSTTASGVEVLQDYGTNYGTGTATHKITLYRAPSGALVFGAGTVQWSWGLDSNHDRGSGAASQPMQQATVNLFADMGAQPATLQAGLTAATASTDTTGATAAITAPAPGGTVQAGAPTTISGTATDAGGGVVGGVEVSTDGSTWHPATGRASWSYTWTPGAVGTATIRARATDDSARTGAVATTSVSVVARTCPCSLWSATVAPPGGPDPDGSGTEVGTRFRSDSAGTVSAIRFYKQTGNTGTHVGHLWTASGTQLATVTFANETASGWQQATLSPAVSIAANTDYIVSYYAPTGHYSSTVGFYQQDLDAPPLHAPADSPSAANGVYGYFGAGGGFPDQAWEQANYWVDVVFSPGGGGGDTTPPTVTARTPASGATGVSTGTTVTATFSEAIQTGTAAVSLTGASSVTGSTSYDATSRTVTFTPSAALTAGTSYTATVSGARDAANNLMAPTSWSFTTAGTPPAGGCPCTIWPATTAPSGAPDSDNSAVELGVKFRSDQAGTITGVRFYKGTGNSGTHTGSLWTSTGTRLATATFTSETATGWQQVLFPTPVSINANTTYVASYYAPVGRYYATNSAFATAGVDRPPLHALRNGVDGSNGIYRYGTGGGFPTSSFQSTNYWVDVVFQPSGPDTSPPTVVTTTPASGATGVATSTPVSATFSEPVQSGTVQVQLTGPGGATVAGTTA